MTDEQLASHLEAEANLLDRMYNDKAKARAKLMRDAAAHLRVDRCTPCIGDGSGEAALAIGEAAFRAGFVAALEFARDEGWTRGGTPEGKAEQAAANAWDEYEPSEDIKALS